MTSTIITSQTEIADATTSTLVATYNHFTGKSIKAFETRAIAERRVAMTLLAAQDLAGHRGTAPNEAPNVLNGVVDHSAPNRRIAALLGEAGIDCASTEAKNGEGPHMTEAELNNGKPKAVTAPKAPKAPKAGSIGAFISAKIAEGMTNEEILTAVQVAKPEAKTTIASIRWYRYR